jgi:hypothetical protein
VKRHFHKLRTHPSRWPRITAGVLLVSGGLLGWLPVLGFWMLPLGVVLLSVDFHPIRRRRRKFDVWWGRSALRLHLLGWWNQSRLRALLARPGSLSE